VIIRFAPEADQDLKDAVHWYKEEGNEELVSRFTEKIDETIGRMVKFPQFNTEVKPGIYRALVNKFPYSIYYSVIDETLEIYAVAHQHRMPFYWINEDG
jgi:plasmid stabilization system protein ParE